MTDNTPEDCNLVAVNTGDGWSLCVEDRSGEVVCYLAWPKNWPETMTTTDLKAKGFEIV